MNTVRRYPRTMAEAFPRDPVYACAIERTPMPLWRSVLRSVWRWL